MADKGPFFFQCLLQRSCMVYNTPNPPSKHTRFYALKVCRSRLLQRNPPTRGKAKTTWWLELAMAMPSLTSRSCSKLCMYPPACLIVLNACIQYFFPIDSCSLSSVKILRFVHTMSFESCVRKSCLFMIVGFPMFSMLVVHIPRLYVECRACDPDTATVWTHCLC